MRALIGLGKLFFWGLILTALIVGMPAAWGIERMKQGKNES